MPPQKGSFITSESVCFSCQKVSCVSCLSVLGKQGGTNHCAIANAGLKNFGQCVVFIFLLYCLLYSRYILYYKQFLIVHFCLLKLEAFVMKATVEDQNWVMVNGGA